MSHWSDKQIEEARAFFRENNLTYYGKPADLMTRSEVADAIPLFASKMTALADVLRELGEDE
jgi:hypothetical protein